MQGFVYLPIVFNIKGIGDIVPINKDPLGKMILFQIEKPFD
jgi:hypothetical protein